MCISRIFCVAEQQIFFYTVNLKTASFMFYDIGYLFMTIKFLLLFVVHDIHGFYRIDRLSTCHVVAVLDLTTT